MYDTGYGFEGAIAASGSKRSASLPPKALKSDYSSGSFATTHQSNNKKKRSPSIKDAWRWIRSIVEDLTAFEQEKQLLKDFIKNLNTELQSLDIPETDFATVTLTSGEQIISVRSITTSLELENIIQKVMAVRDYLINQNKLEAKVKDMLGLPVDCSSIEMEIMINHEKQKRLESELQEVMN